MADRPVEQEASAARPPVPGEPVTVAKDQARSRTAPQGLATPRQDAPQGMIPGRSRRRTKIERGSMRVLATGGIIGLATALGAVLVSQDVAGWIVGLAVGLTSVVLAAILWSSRQL